MNIEAQEFFVLLEKLMRTPTAPFREDGIRNCVREAVARVSGVCLREDRWGNVLVSYESAPESEKITFCAHMDHPAFVDGEFLGSIDPRYHNPNNAITLHPNGIGTWNLIPFERVNGTIVGGACDDLIGCAVAVGTVLHHARERTRCSVHALLTIAEEVGLYGAALAVESGLLSRQATVISLETSPALNPTQFHAGCIVRVGDRKTVFTPEITERLTDMSVRCGIAHQVRLMDGGTCEATVFQRAGFRTGAICVALGNPHNQGPSLSCAPEYVSESDTLAMLALAVAFSEDRVGPTSRRFSLEDLTKKAGEQWQMRRGPNFSSDKHDCSPTT